HYLSPTMPVIFVSDDTPTPPPYPLSLHDALPISSSNIQVFFNEPVTVDSSSFTVVCDGNPQTFQVSGSGTDTITLDPDSDLPTRSEEHTSELQSLRHLVCRLLLEKKKHVPEHVRH